MLRFTIFMAVISFLSFSLLFFQFSGVSEAVDNQENLQENIVLMKKAVKETSVIIEKIEKKVKKIEETY